MLKPLFNALIGYLIAPKGVFCPKCLHLASSHGEDARIGCQEQSTDLVEGSDTFLRIKRKPCNCDLTVECIAANIVRQKVDRRIQDLTGRKEYGVHPNPDAGGAALDNPPKAPTGESMRVPFREGDDIPPRR